MPSSFTFLSRNFYGSQDCAIASWCFLVSSLYLLKYFVIYYWCAICVLKGPFWIYAIVFVLLLILLWKQEMYAALGVQVKFRHGDNKSVSYHIIYNFIVTLPVCTLPL